MSEQNYSPVSIDPLVLMDEYLDGKTWLIKENSTSSWSINGLSNHVVGAVMSAYWLNKIYNTEISNAHKSCDIHLHDLGFYGGYCSGWNLNSLLEEGINNVGNQINSKPAKHMSSACQQIVNFFGIMSNEFAGAQAVNQFDTRLAPFIRKDNMTDAEIKQCLQAFAFNVNQPSRWSGQAPFSNITLDLTVPEDLKNVNPVIAGRKQPFTYGELQPEIDKLNLILFDVFMEGDSKGGLFQYPIPTINIQKDFDWDSNVSNKLFELDAKYGTFYFSNFVNTDMSPSDARSMCMCDDSMIKVDLEEDCIEYDGKFYSLEQAKSKAIIPKKVLKG